ncbi:MAG: histidine--tRNA ligase [Nitrospinae bacterium]|nr:histidine--tRNA ligase [Nitrospinota bacterium]
MGEERKFTAVKGVKDILPDAVAVWREVERRAREQFALFGFREIVLPIFEKSGVFIKAVGEGTDIVQKEMYTFEDQGGESITLRPEGTASCVRAYIEHSMFHPPGNLTKLFYLGPMFRRERPQAGRYRQFFQIGAELFGAAEPAADADIIHLLHLFLGSIGVKSPKLLLNSLGDDKCRGPFKEALVEFLAKNRGHLCENCRERYEKNPLRVFDCKVEKCVELMKTAPTLDKHYCPECSAHFSKVRELLGRLGVPYELNPRMVRGLDYYNRTVFEVTAEGLGSQNSIAGGGRYDDLVKNSGGPAVPATGFAVGMERLVESIGAPLATDHGRPDVFVVYMNEAEEAACGLSAELRVGGVSVERLYKPTGFKNQFGKADKSGARYALIIGGDELAKKTAVIKDLSTGAQVETPFGSVAEFFKNGGGARPPAKP